MNWSSLRKLVWLRPEERWAPDLLFVGAAVFVTLWLIQVEHHLILGIAAGMCILAVREISYHYLVRRKRGTHKDAA